LEERVRDDTNSDVDRLDIGLNLRNRFLYVRERRVVRELLASVVDFTLGNRQTVVNILQFSLESLHIFAYIREGVLDISQLIGVCTVIPSHPLEVS